MEWTEPKLIPYVSLSELKFGSGFGVWLCGSTNSALHRKGLVMVYGRGDYNSQTSDISDQFG